MKIIFTLIILSFYAPSLWAGILKGKVLRNDNEPIGFASISIPGTEYGTVSNEAGEYSIQVPNGSYTFRCEAMAFQPGKQTIEINDGTTILDFILREEAFELEGATISAKFEDRAIGIMKKVIGSRAKYAKKMQSLSTDIYLKGSLSINEAPKSILGQQLDAEDIADLGIDSDRKGMLYTLEQVTKYWYKYPNKSYHYVESVRESGSNNGLGFAQMPPIINVYENNITILNGLNKRGFISPASENAFFYYNFKYLGSYNDGEFEVFKIQVTPKRKYEPLFTGHLYVVDGLWLFQALELKVDRTSQIDLVDTLILEQYFRPRHEDVWVINTQTLSPKLNIMGFKASGTFFTNYMNVKINEPIADSIFKPREITSYDSAANDRDSSYWNKTRPIALEKAEELNYKFQDSLSNVQPIIDSNFKVKRWRLTAPVLYSNNIRKLSSPLSFKLYNPIYNTGFNTVEGLYTHVNLAVNTRKYWNDKRDRVKSSSELGLKNRFSLGDFNYNPLLYFQHKWYNKDWSNAGITTFNMNIGSVIVQYDTSNPIVSNLNTLYSLILGHNYAKLFRQKQVEAKVSHIFPLGWSVSGSLGYYEKNSLFNTTDYTWSNINHYTSNSHNILGSDAANTALIMHLGAEYNFGQKFIRYPKYKSVVHNKHTTIGASYTKAIGGFGNLDADFDKWKVYYRDLWSLKLLGKLQVNATVGGFLNDNVVHFSDYNHFNGNQTFLASGYNKSFQLAPYYKYSNTEELYGRLHLEWQMGGWLSNKIPLFRQLNWHFVTGTNSFYIDKDNYYAEAYFGVDNIGIKMFRFLRVDAILGYESMIAKPTFGMRVGIKMNGLNISL